MNTLSALYAGRVVHERSRPRHHRFDYTVCSMLVDLDELSLLDRDMPLFGYNRAAPISFHDRDHGPTDGSPLRPWVEALMEQAGIPHDGGPIRLLCYPRILGYAFNPLSVYFCYRKSGGLAAILYEVCNTFRERHTYVIPVSEMDGAPVEQICDKALYVSPFIEMDATYHFKIAPPDEGIGIHIRQEDSSGPLLYAGFTGKRRALTRYFALRLLLSFPFMTIKIITGIHWEALKLWLKGTPVFSHLPAKTPVAISIESPTIDKA